MATKLLSDLLTDLRNKLSEVSAKYWTDTELYSYLNEGIKNVAKRAEVIQVTSTITVVAGTQEYSMPADIVRLSRVEFNETGNNRRWSLQYVDYNSADEYWGGSKTIQTGQPAIYTLWGYQGGAATLKITLYPTPAIGGTLKLYYYQVPPDYTSGQTVALPDGWYNLPVLYAEFTALRKDADPRWQEAKQIYESELDDLIGLSRRLTDGAGMVGTERGSMIPDWLYNGSY